MSKFTSSVIALLAASTLAACKPDPEASANELFVKSVPLWHEAQALDATDKDALARKISLYEQVAANLQTIVSDYPSSGLAVDLVSSGVAKNLDRKEVEAQLAAAKLQMECLSQKALCLIRDIEAHLGEIEQGPARVDVTARLAVLHARTGNKDVARRYLTEAIAGKARHLNENDPQAEENIIAALVLLGRAAEAEARISKLGTGAQLNYAMSTIAELRYDYGDTAGAVGMLENPKLIEARPSLAFSLIGRLIEDGNIAAVTKFLDEEGNKSYRERYLPAIVAHHIRSGHAEKSEEILLRYPLEAGKTDRDAVMAQAFAEIGDYDQSLAHYEKSAAKNRHAVLPDLAYMAAKAGNMPAAKAHLSEIARVAAEPAAGSEFAHYEKMLFAALRAGDEASVAKALGARLNEFLVSRLDGEALGYKGKSDLISGPFDGADDWLRLSGFIRGATEKDPPDLGAIQKTLEHIPENDTATDLIAARQLVAFGLTPTAEAMIQKQGNPSAKAELAAIVANAYLDAATAGKMP